MKTQTFQARSPVFGIQRFRIGSTVRVTNEREPVTVTGIDEKDGMMIVDYTDPSGAWVWAWADSISQVIKL